MKHSFKFTSDVDSSSKIKQQKYFRGDDVIHDVTGWPQICPPIFFYIWKMNISHNNWRTSKDIIIKHDVYMYLDTTIMSLLINMDNIIARSPGLKISQILKLP